MVLFFARMLQKLNRVFNVVDKQSCYHLQEKLVTSILMWCSKEVQATEYVSETTCDHSIVESYQEFFFMRYFSPHGTMI